MGDLPTAADNRFYNDINNFVKLSQDISIIKEHILVLNSEGGQQRDEIKKMNEHISGLRIDFAAERARREWSDKLMWIVISVSVGALVSSILNLILKR